VSAERAKALDEQLAAWLGWFSSKPLAEDLERLVEQLEARHVSAKAAAQV
jgi:hypothetical protein